MRLRLTPDFLIKALGVYSCGVVGLISFLILASDESDVHQKAIIKVAWGLVLCFSTSIVLWIRCSLWTARSSSRVKN